MTDALEAIILTDRFFAVVASSEKAQLLSEKGIIKTGDLLFDHFPALKTHVFPENPDRGLVLNGIPVKDLTAEVRVIPVGEFVSFTISGNPAGQPRNVIAGEMELLREQNKHLMAVIEEAPIGIMLIDEKGQIAYMNKKQEENSRKKREDLIGLHIKQAYPKA